MPDVFVAADTSNYSDYYRKLVSKGVVNTFAMEYFDKNRARLTSRFKSFDDYRKQFEFSADEIQSFIKKGEDEGIKFEQSQFDVSKNEILLILKGLVATNMWQTNEYFQIINENDKVIENALKIISDNDTYNKLLGNQ